MDLKDALAAAPAVAAIPALRGDDAFVYDNDHVIHPRVAELLARGNCRAYAVQDTWAAAIWCEPKLPAWYAYAMRGGIPQTMLSMPSLEDLIETLHDILD